MEMLKATTSKQGWVSRHSKNWCVLGRRNSEANNGPSPRKNSIKEEKGPGDFANFPEIHRKTIEKLTEKGIVSLFPVQYSSFKNVYNREDLIVRDLTGSGKTLAFALPLVEFLRAKKLFGSGLQAIILAPTRELAL